MKLIDQRMTPIETSWANNNCHFLALKCTLSSDIITVNLVSPGNDTDWNRWSKSLNQVACSGTAVYLGVRNSGMFYCLSRLFRNVSFEGHGYQSYKQICTKFTNLITAVQLFGKIKWIKYLKSEIKHWICHSYYCKRCTDIDQEKCSLLYNT